MNDDAPKVTLGRLEWGVIIALLLSAGSTLFSAGIVYGDVRSQDKRLAIVETKTDAMQSQVGIANARLASIETNVNWLVDQYKRDRDRDSHQ